MFIFYRKLGKNITYVSCFWINLDFLLDLNRCLIKERQKCDEGLAFEKNKLSQIKGYS